MGFQVDEKLLQEHNTSTQTVGFLDAVKLAPTAKQLSNVGDKEIGVLVKNLQEVISGLTIHDTDIFHFKKSEFRLSYDFIVIASKSGNDVSYFSILLAATGPTGATPTDIINDIENGVITIIPGVSIEKRFVQKIMPTLEKAYPNADIKPIYGLIVPAEVNLESMDVARYIAGEAISIVGTEIMVRSGMFNEQSFLDILYTRDGKPSYKQKNSVTILPEGIAISQLDEVKRVEVVVDFNLETMNRANTGPNDEAGSLSPVSTYGFIEVIPYEDTIDERTGLETVKFAPLVVLNGIDLMLESRGQASLALTTIDLMRKDNRWIEVIAANLKDGKDVGYLAKFMTGPDGKHMKAIPLSKSKKTSERQAIAGRLIQGDAGLAIDIQTFGSNIGHLHAYQFASGEGQIANAARKAIVKANHELTGGTFPLDYPIGEMFAERSVDLPYGDYIVDGETRPLSEVDITFLSRYPENEDLAYQLIDTTVGNAGDPYLDRLKIYEQLGLNATIKGVLTRIYMSGSYMDELEYALEDAGIAPEAPVATIDTGVRRFNTKHVIDRMASKNTHARAARVRNIRSVRRPDFY